MDCTKTCLVIFLALTVSTAGFVLTLTGWFAPPLNAFVDGVRLAGPITLLIGTGLLILSCIMCAFVQGKCCDCCYICSSHSRKDVLYACEENQSEGNFIKADMQRSPLILRDMRAMFEAVNHHPSQPHLNAKGLQVDPSGTIRAPQENGGLKCHVEVPSVSVDCDPPRYEQECISSNPLQYPYTYAPGMATVAAGANNNGQDVPFTRTISAASTVECGANCPSPTSAYSMARKMPTRSSSIEHESSDIWLRRQQSSPQHQGKSSSLAVGKHGGVGGGIFHTPSSSPLLGSPKRAKGQKIRPVSEHSTLKEQSFTSPGDYQHVVEMPPRVTTRLTNELGRTVATRPRTPVSEIDGQGKGAKEEGVGVPARSPCDACQVTKPNRGQKPPTYGDVMHKKKVYDVTV